MTKMDLETVQALERCQKRNQGYPVTVREVMHELGVRSSGTAMARIDYAVDAGLIKNLGGKRGFVSTRRKKCPTCGRAA